MADNKNLKDYPVFTLLIDNLYDATINLTETEFYNLLFLPDALSIVNRAQVISIFGSSNQGWNGNDKIESFAVSVGGAIDPFKNGDTGNRKIVIGGNYYLEDTLKYDYSLWDSHFIGNEPDPSSHYFIGNDIDKEGKISGSFSADTFTIYINDYLNSRGQVVRSGGKEYSPGQYNLYHVSVNDDYISGAVNFDCPVGELVLTAQNGAAMSNYYQTYTGFDLDDPKKARLVKDEDIAIRSDAYNLASHYEKFKYRGFLENFEGVDEWDWHAYNFTYFDYAAKGVPSAPSKKTISYTINAKNKLVVSSDLVGKIQSNAAAFISRYAVKGEKDGVTIWTVNYSVDGYQVIAAGVRAEDLQLESNYRADITVTNNQNLFRAKFGDSYYNDPDYVNNHGDDETFYTMITTPVDGNGNIQNYYWDVYDPTVAYREYEVVGLLSSKKVVYPPTANPYVGYIDKGEKGDGKSDVTINGSIQARGTSIGGGASADNNKVISTGIHIDQGFTTGEDTVWAGSITVTTSDVQIVADLNHLGYIAYEDWLKLYEQGASAKNNLIGAYGLLSDSGTITISKMGSLLKDKAYSTAADAWQNASITVTCSNNSITALNGGVNKDGEDLDVTTGSEIRTAAIWTDKLVLHEATDAVNFTVNSYGNNIYAAGDKYDDDTDQRIFTYGIKAKSSIEFGYFDANVTVNTSDVKAVGINAGTIDTYGNLNGTITVSSGIGISTGTLTVHGVIDSAIRANKGIWVGSNLNAQAFTGEIDADNYGLSINKMTGMMNVAGVIYGNKDGANYVVSSFQDINLRISGSVVDTNFMLNQVLAGAAIRTEAWHSEWGSFVSNSYKFNDSISVVSNASVKGRIELGGGVNNIFIDSDGHVQGAVTAEGGAVNFMFNLKTPDGFTTLELGNGGMLEEDDKTLKDSSTITLNLNYAEKGLTPYTLISYNYGSLPPALDNMFGSVEEAINSSWANIQHPRVIAMHYQGDAYSVVLTPDKTGTKAEGTVSVKTSNGYVDVTVRYQNMSLQVELSESMPAAPAVESTATLDHFINDNIYADENGKFTVEWGTFANYIDDKLNAGTLADEGGVVFDKVKQYRLTYVLRDASGQQISEQLIKYIDFEDSKGNLITSLESSQEIMATLVQGVDPDTVHSIKLVGIAVIGEDENKKVIDADFKFSLIDSSYEDKYSCMDFEWDELHDSLLKLIQAGKIIESGQTFNFDEKDCQYEVTFSIYSKRGAYIGSYSTTVSAESPQVRVNMEDLAAATEGKVGNWTDIGKVTLSQVKLTNVKQNISIIRDCEFDGTPSLTEPVETVELEWDSYASAWKDQVKHGTLLVTDSKGDQVAVTAITGYEILFDILDVNGNVLIADTTYVVTQNNSLGEIASSVEWSAKDFANEFLDANTVDIAAKVVLKKVTLMGTDANSEEHPAATHSGVISDKESIIRNKVVTLDWSQSATDWNELIKINGLVDSTGVIFKEITGCKLDLVLVYKDGSLDNHCQNIQVEGNPGTITLDIEKDIIEKYGYSSLNIKVDDIVSVNISNITLEGLDASKKVVTVDYPFTETQNQNDVKDIASGIIFNWSVMYEDIASQAVSGLLRDSNGNKLPASTLPDGNYIYRYNMTFEVYDEGGVYLGTYQESYEDFYGRLSLADVQKVAGLETAADAKIKDIQIDVVYGSNAGDVFTLHYDAPVTSASQFCNTIKLSWSDPGVGYTATGYAVTFIVKDKNGKVLGEVSRVNNGSNNEFIADLSDVAVELGINQSEIGSIQLQNVSTLGVEVTKQETVAINGKAAQDSAQLVVNLDQLYNELKGNTALLKDGMDTVERYVITYQVYHRNGGSETALGLPVEVRISNAAGTDIYDFKAEDIAQKHGVDAKDIVIKITRFEVQGRDSTQGSASPQYKQVLIGFDEAGEVTNAASPIVILDSQELQTYLKQNSGVGLGDIATITYTYKLLDKLGNEIGLVNPDGTESTTDTLSVTIKSQNGEPGKLYLKDIEHLLDEQNILVSDIGSLKITGIKVTDTAANVKDMSVIVHDKIARKAVLDWSNEVAGIEGAITAGTLLDANGNAITAINGYKVKYALINTSNGKLLEVIEYEDDINKDTTKLEINLAELAQKHSINDASDLAIELVDLAVKGDGDAAAAWITEASQLPETYVTLDWSDKVWGDAVKSYKVYYELLDKDGKVLGSNSVAVDGDKSVTSKKLYLEGAVNDVDAGNVATVRVVKVDAFDKVSAEVTASVKPVDNLTVEGVQLLTLDWSEDAKVWAQTLKVGTDEFATITGYKVYFALVNAKNETVYTSADGKVTTGASFTVDAEFLAENNLTKSGIVGIELHKIEVVGTDTGGAAQTAVGYDYKNDVSFAVTGEEGAKKATLNWGAFCTDAVTEGVFKEITSVVVSYVLRTGDGKTDGKVYKHTETYDPNKVADSTSEEITVQDGYESVEIVTITITGKNQKDENTTEVYYDRVQNFTYAVDLSAWNDEAQKADGKITVVVDLYDSKNKKVGEYQHTFENFSKWQDTIVVPQKYAEQDGAVRAEISSITSVKNSVTTNIYSLENKYITLEHSQWQKEVPAATGYEATYVLRDSKNTVIKTFTVNVTTETESRIDLAGMVNAGLLTQAEMQAVVSAEVIRVDADSIGTVFDAYEDTLTMKLVWDVAGVSGDTLKEYKVSFMLKDASGNPLTSTTYPDGLVTVTVTDKFYDIDLRKIAGELGGIDVDSIKSAEIVAVEWIGTGGNTQIYAGYEAKGQVKNTARGFELVWQDWKNEYSSLFTGAEEFFQITYEAIDKNGKVLQPPQTIILKEAFTSYRVDVEQLAATLGLPESEINYVRLSNITLLDSKFNAIANTSYSGFQDVIKNESAGVGFMLDWETKHKSWMAQITTGTLTGKDSGNNPLAFEVFSGYEITFALYDANGILLKDASGNACRIAGEWVESYQYFADVEKLAARFNGVSASDIAKVTLEEIKLVGKYGEDKDVFTEFVAGNMAVIQWQDQHKAWNPSGQYTYSIDIELKDDKSNVINVTINDLREPFYTLDIADLANQGYNLAGNPVSVTLKNVSLKGSVTQEAKGLNQLYMLNTGVNATKLDWTLLDQELQNKIANGVLLDKQGVPATGIDHYKITYVLLNNNGDAIDLNGNGLADDGIVVDPVPNGDTTYIVDLSKYPGAASAKLVNVEMIDSKGEAYSYSWSDSVSMVSHFVESYNEEERTLTISWHGLKAEDFGLEEIASYEIEYTLIDKYGNPLGSTIGFKFDGDQDHFTIEGVENGYEVKWRIRTLGDEFGLYASAWSEERTVSAEVISAGISSEFALPEDLKINCTVSDAILQKESKVVNAVAQLEWEPVESARPIRKYIIEYCELEQPFDLQLSAPASMSFAEYITGNDSALPHLFQNDASDTSYGYYRKVVDPATGQETLEFIQPKIYTKVVTGTEVAISQNNGSYVYWRIRAVDDSNNTVEGYSDWLAGTTYRVWTTPDDAAPVFTKPVAGMLDVDFPVLSVLHPELREEDELGTSIYDPDTDYEALLGWDAASDDGGSGIHSYAVYLKDENGDYVKVKEVSFEDRIPFGYGKWQSSELDIDGIYRVSVYDNGTQIKLVDASGTEVDYLTDVTLKKVGDSNIMELSWYARTDFSGMEVKVEFFNHELKQWEGVVDDNIDNYSYTHYDYTCRLHDLGERTYDYKIVAKDFSGNESEAITGSFVADKDRPEFTATDETVAGKIDYIVGSINDPVMLDGSVYWSAASDSESKVRSYRIDFTRSLDNTDALTVEFDCGMLDNKYTEISFENCTELPFQIVAGNYYSVTVNGTTSGALLATENGKLRLDFYVPSLNAAAVTVAHNNITHNVVNVAALESETFEWKSTRIMLQGVKPSDEKPYTVVVEGGESYDVFADENGALFIDHDLMYKTVTIKSSTGEILFGTPHSGKMITPQNATLFYRADMSDFPSRLEANGYKYTVTAIDYFGQTGELRKGEIVADFTAPVFPNPTDKEQTEVSGLFFDTPDNPIKQEGEEPTKYSAWIGWVKADDGEGGTGVRRYTLTINAGDYSEDIFIAEEDLYGYSVASWSNSSLQAGNYQVVLADGSVIAAALSGDGKSVEWRTNASSKGNLKGQVVTIQYEDNGVWKTLGNFAGTSGEVKGNQYQYSFISGKTFAEWTLKGSGSTGGLDSGKVYEVFINDNLSVDAAVRLIDGKLRLTWTIDGNFVEADTSTKIVIKEDGAVVYDSTNNDHRNSDSFEKSYTYYECAWQITDITDENLTYTISATDYCNNVTGERDSLTGSVLVDTGDPKFPGTYSATWGSPEEGSDGMIKILPAFSWEPAVDSDGDLGVRYYELYTYITDPKTGKVVETLEKTFSQAEVVKWNEGDKSEPLYQLDRLVNWGEYEYKIVAYDYFGNSSSIEGTFGTPDYHPPVGEFTHEFTSDVQASWEKVKLRVFEVDEEGDPIADPNDDTGFKTKLIDYRGKLKEASVTLDWGDDKYPDFQDEHKIYYRVTVSNYIGEQENLTKPDYESYDFWTTGTSITFDNKTPGRPVGIFENWKNVYWCVTVYDEFFNGGDNSENSSLKSDWYEFQFKAVDKNIYNANAENEVVWLVNLNDPTGTPFLYPYSEVQNEVVAIRNQVEVIDEGLYNMTKLGMTSAPNSIKAEYLWIKGREADKENAKHAGTAAISWKQNNEVLGVYEYEITLSNELHTYTARTTDADRKGAASDLAKTVSVSYDSVNQIQTFKIDDLSKFLGLYNIPDGDYKLKISALDTNGRKISSSAFNFHMDTTAPDEVKAITVDNVADNINSEKYFESVLNWETPAGGSDIDYYEVRYRIWIAGEEPNDWTRKKVYGNSFVLPSVREGVEYEFQIVAVDTAGNRSTASKLRSTYEGVSSSDDMYPDTVTDALTMEKVVKLDAQGKPMMDEKGNYIYEIDGNTGLPIERYKYQVRWSEPGGSREIIKQTVGRGDTGDTIVICESSSIALTLTVDELRAIFAEEKDDIKIEIFKIGSNGKAQSWKKYTVNDNCRVVSDLLLEANTVYAVKVYAVGARAVSSYQLTLDKTNIGGDGNNGNDDSYDKAVANNLNLVGLSNIPGDSQTANLANWVGYGDASDIKRLSLQTTGKYTFTLEGASANTVLTVYEAIKTVNSKGEVKITHKKLDSIVCTGSTIDGVTSDVLALEAGKDYYYEVKIGDKKIIGTEYQVKITCIDSYPAATTYDDDPLDSTAWKKQILALDATLDSDLSGKALWVGAGDTVDYCQLTANSLYDLEPEKEYQLKIDGIEGNAIKVAIGYFVDGKFKTLISKTGTKDAESLVMHCIFDRDQLSNGQLYVQVSANGKNGNSRYSMYMTAYDNLVDNSDDTAEKANVELMATAPMSKALPAVNGWVGFNDPTDYIKVSLAEDGLYQFTVSGVSNNVNVAVLKKVVDSKGTVSYIKVDTLNATAAKNTVTGKMLMLDASVGNEYYVSVTAPGHKSGKNSDYTLVMNMLESSVDLGSDANKVFNLVNSAVAINGTEAENYIYTAPAAGGAYQFRISNTNASGSVKLTVYELLDNGKTRTVKSITVKAGAVGTTGYLWLDDEVVKNGTGIYQVEIKGSSKKVTGNIQLTVDGYSFKDHIEAGDDAANNIIGTENWVGIGDSSDVYEYKVDTVGVHEFTLGNINGNNIKLSIKDAATGKVLKSFTAAANSTQASFAYAFANTGTYQIVVEAAGKNKFSKYTLNTVDRSGNEQNGKLDNSIADLGSPSTEWSVNDADKLVNTALVKNDVNGWVGLGDAKDFYGVMVDSSGNYDLNITGIGNDVKVTLYEATTYYTGSAEIKSGKAIKSVTAKGINGGAVLSGVYLDASKDYYIMVSAGSTSGSKNTEYSINLARITDAAASQTGIIGNDNTADTYLFTAVDGATGITLTLDDTRDKAVATLYKVDIDPATGKGTGKYIKVKSITVTGSKSLSIGTGELCLEKGMNYVVEVTAPNAKSDNTVSYTLEMNSWEFGNYASSTADDMPESVSNSLSFNINGVAAASRNAVWKNGKVQTLWDAVDYFKVDIFDAGSYTLDLTGINGNNIKVSIGTVTNGKFKSLQSVTGAAAAESLILSRKLDSNTTYYIKVEANGSSSASEYELTLTNNEKRKLDDGTTTGKSVFNNADDTWKQVAGNIDSVAYGAGDTVSDWVGFGDSVDVFKIRLDDFVDNYDDNGRLVFSGSGDTQDALIDKEIKLTLVDANGKSVALTFDKESGNYTSKNVLTAGVDYFLTVKNSNEKKQNIDYNIDINLA